MLSTVPFFAICIIIIAYFLYLLREQSKSEDARQKERREDVQRLRDLDRAAAKLQQDKLSAQIAAKDDRIKDLESSAQHFHKRYSEIIEEAHRLARALHARNVAIDFYRACERFGVSFRRFVAIDWPARKLGPRAFDAVSRLTPQTADSTFLGVLGPIIAGPPETATGDVVFWRDVAATFTAQSNTALDMEYAGRSNLVRLTFLRRCLTFMVLRLLGFSSQGRCVIPIKIDARGRGLSVRVGSRPVQLTPAGRKTLNQLRRRAEELYAQTDIGPLFVDNIFAAFLQPKPKAKSDSEASASVVPDYCIEFAKTDLCRAILAEIDPDLAADDPTVRDALRTGLAAWRGFGAEVDTGAAPMPPAPPVQDEPDEPEPDEADEADNAARYEARRQEHRNVSGLSDEEFLAQVQSGARTLDAYDTERLILLNRPDLIPR